MNDEFINVNKYQTKLTKTLIDTLPREVYLQILEYINNVKFINWLIQPEEVRGFAKDRPKYCDLPEGHPDKFYNDCRIIVDITKPHILENMDYFRERALFYMKHGKYTDIIPNKNPMSEWTLFWKEELRRWRYGLVRPEDGEWIPGSLYFYWNYSNIWIVKESDTKDLNIRVRGFPDIWLGDYLFYHYKEQARLKNKHVKMLKSRGIGASFKMAAESVKNMYVFPGSGNPNFHLSYDKSYLSGDKGVFGKVMDNLDWIAENTPLPKLRIGDAKKELFIQLGYTDNYGVRKGLLSSVNGISLKDNPDKARGVRGPLIHYEEDGLFPNLEVAWNINRKAVEEGNIAFGQMIALGTGGTQGADFAGAQKLFYNPNSYNIYGIPNVFDQNTTDESICGFFWGAYLSRRGCINNNGEPDVIKALIEIILNQYDLRVNSQDTSIVVQAMAEEPIIPQHAVMNFENNTFPVMELKETLASIMVNYNKFISSHMSGDIVLKQNGDVEFVEDIDKTPIRDFPFTGTNKKGAIEIFELPTGKFNNRYIIGVDTFDDDKVKYSNSLGSVMVFDRWTRRIVAEYTGRPSIADEFYDIVLRLSLLYGAMIMYENNKKGLFGYFARQHKLHLLADTPQFLKDKIVMKSTSSEIFNTTKGVNALAEINAHARRLQAKWMLEEAYVDNKNILDFSEIDEEKIKEENQIKKLNVHNIRSIGYIKECLAWNGIINADRISAMNMVMIYDEALSTFENGIIFTPGGRVKTKSSDEFFSRMI